MFSKSYITQIYSGITSGRVLDGELLYTKMVSLQTMAAVVTSDGQHKLKLQW